MSIEDQTDQLTQNNNFESVTVNQNQLLRLKVNQQNEVGNISTSVSENSDSNNLEGTSDVDEGMDESTKQNNESKNTLKQKKVLLELKMKGKN